MRGTGRRAERTGKGLLCASACLLLGAVSHVAAGGRLPGPGALALLFAALTVLGALLFGGRRRRFDVTTMALGGAQFALHLAFHHLSAPGSGHAMPGRSATASGPHAHHMTGHHMTGHEMTGQHIGRQHAGHGAAMSPTDMAEGLHAGHDMSPAMTFAHALATFGTALCVIHGERVLRGLAALLAPVLRFPEPRAVHVTPLRRPRPAPSARPRFGVLLARSRSRRGPPPLAPAPV